MSRILILIATLIITPVFAPAASAQKVLGIGANQTAIGQMSAAIAAVVSKKTDMQMRTQTVAATEQYVPMVNANKIEFGIANSMQTLMSIRGTGVSQGHKNENLRIVGILFSNQLAVLVPAASSIKSVHDLRGKRTPSGWTAQPVGRYLVGAYLANAGLSWNDVTQVPVAGFAQQYQAFQEGRLDNATSILGQASVTKVDSRIRVRFVSLDASPEAVKRMQAVVPGAYLTKVQPRKGLVGVNAPIDAMTLDYVLFSNNKVTDEIIYKVTKALYESEAALRATGPLFRRYRSAGLARPIDAQYHPGAIRFFKEKGMWPPK